MNSGAKKMTMVLSYYAAALMLVTAIVLYSPSVSNAAGSLSLFYLTSFAFTAGLGYYLFHTTKADFHHKEGVIETPNKRDVSKRKVLAIAFLYATLFILSFIFEQISYFVFAMWPVMFFLALLLLLDRRLVFDVPSKMKIPWGQKYGLRLLVTGTALSSMWTLHEYVSSKPQPLGSIILHGWEEINVCFWCFPVAMISALLIADWITVSVHHLDKKNFFKRADVILFFGIQLLLILFILAI